MYVSICRMLVRIIVLLSKSAQVKGEVEKMSAANAEMRSEEDTKREGKGC